MTIALSVGRCCINNSFEINDLRTTQRRSRFDLDQPQGAMRCKSLIPNNFFRLIYATTPSVGKGLQVDREMAHYPQLLSEKYQIQDSAQILCHLVKLVSEKGPHPVDAI